MRSTIQPLKIRGVPPKGRFSVDRPVIMTFGIFDAVHQGQQAMLNRVRLRANEIGGVSVALVFRPRPSETLEVSPPQPYYTASDESVRLIRAMGLEHVGVVRFDRSLAETEAPSFLRRLVARMPVHEIWLGPNAMMGRGPAGKGPALAKAALEVGAHIRVFEVEQLTDSGRLLSTSFNARDFGAVSGVLGREYELPACVIEELPCDEAGFSAYSLITPDRLCVPPDGDYAGSLVPASYASNSNGRIGDWRQDALILIRSGRPISGLSTMPNVSLIVKNGRNLVNEFVRVQFRQVLKSSIRELWGRVSVEGTRLKQAG